MFPPPAARDGLPQEPGGGRRQGRAPAPATQVVTVAAIGTSLNLDIIHSAQDMNVSLAHSTRYTKTIDHKAQFGQIQIEK